jgi:hypothetical protein
VLRVLQTVRKHRQTTVHHKQTQPLKNMFSGSEASCSSHSMMVLSYTLDIVLMKVIILPTYESINGMSWGLLPFHCE